MEEKFATITIEEEYQGGMFYDDNTETLPDIDTIWCLERSFLINSSINLQAIQQKMA